LLYTADGGLTWIISSTPFSGGDLSFIDADNGWMLADLGVGAGSNAVAVFQTTDGGATWTQTYTNDPNLPDASDSLPLGGLKSDLLPRDMQTAWVGGVIYSPGTVYLFRTDDGGRNWSPVNLELPSGAENFELGIDRDQMQFVTANDGFLIVRMSGDSTQTAVYVTNDGGETWRLTPTLIPQAGQSDFVSAEEVVIYSGEQFYVTRDAALTWTTISPDIVFGDSFATMDFVNPDNGWIITVADAQRALYRTHNGGATWLPVTLTSLLSSLIGCRPATPPPATSVDQTQTTPDPAVETTSNPVATMPSEAVEIRKAQYQLGATDALQIVQLTDGKFEQGTPGTDDFVSILVTDFVAVGDLNTDGTDEAAALISENYGC
jgi:photosystem II stability/assembly factor-like uncharacterized protein